MFEVTIGLKKVDQSESLAVACRMFIEEIQKMIRDNGADPFTIFEASWVETEIDGAKCIMNFDAIRNFSHAIGILKEDGSLRHLCKKIWNLNLLSLSPQSRIRVAQVSKETCAIFIFYMLRLFL